MAQIPLRKGSEFSLSDVSTRCGWGYQNINSQMNFCAESETKGSGSIIERLLPYICIVYCKKCFSLYSIKSYEDIKQLLGFIKSSELM